MKEKLFMLMLICTLTFAGAGAVTAQAADSSTDVSATTSTHRIKGSTISAKGYKIYKVASNGTVKVKIKAKKGYKVYYSTKKSGFKKNKVVKSGKKKSISISKASTVYIYTAKKNAKFSAKKAKNNALSYSISTADLNAATSTVTDSSTALSNLQAQYDALQAQIDAAAEDAQRALDQQAIQNIMSRHIMYHCYGYHEEEMNEIWVQEAANQATASFGNSGGYWAGWDSIWESYVTNHTANWLAYAEEYCVDNGIYTQEEIDAMTDEELEELVNTYGGVGQLLLHVTTTGIIEIAADGQTAKCFWYSPGIVAESGQDTNSIWEMYGVDFVKEDGVWKIWHLHMYTDTMGSYGSLDRQSSSTPMHFSGQNIVGDDDDPTSTYYMWSADRLVSEMATVLIPTEYDSWSWDDQNFGPTRAQWETLIASEGWSDILAAWDSLH
ncbi:MAG: nuclear transport factor 2 family protein [Eubacterium sp.]|nr:nuclear transport factor 2 family protein [Eubacterium sp.]